MEKRDLASTSASYSTPLSSQHYMPQIDDSLRLLTERLSTETKDIVSAFQMLPTLVNTRFVDNSQLIFNKIIGSGSFGTVFKGILCQQDVAIKQLTVKSIVSELGEISSFYTTDSDESCSKSYKNRTLEVLKALDKEVTILKELHHPKIVLFMGVCLEPPCIITEYCARGSLFDVLKRAKSKPSYGKHLTWRRRIGLALDAAIGMNYLHSHPNTPILHRDLKSPNLLVDESSNCKVADFNTSRFVDASTASTMSATNPRWMAPEVVLNGQPHTKASDIYPFGIILWEILTWKVPFEDDSHVCRINACISIYDKLRRNQRPPIPSPEDVAGGPCPVYDEFVELIKECWDFNPDVRPPYSVIVDRLRLMRDKVQAVALSNPHDSLDEQSSAELCNNRRHKKQISAEPRICSKPRGLDLSSSSHINTILENSQKSISLSHGFITPRDYLPNPTHTSENDLEAPMTPEINIPPSAFMNHQNTNQSATEESDRDSISNGTGDGGVDINPRSPFNYSYEGREGIEGDSGSLSIHMSSRGIDEEDFDHHTEFLHKPLSEDNRDSGEIFSDKVEIPGARKQLELNTEKKPLWQKVKKVLIQDLATDSASENWSMLAQIVIKSIQTGSGSLSSTSSYLMPQNSENTILDMPAEQSPNVKKGWKNIKDIFSIGNSFDSSSKWGGFIKIVKEEVEKDKLRREKEEIAKKKRAQDSWAYIRSAFDLPDTEKKRRPKISHPLWNMVLDLIFPTDKEEDEEAQKRQEQQIQQKKEEENKSKLTIGMQNRNNSWAGVKQLLLSNNFLNEDIDGEILKKHWNFLNVFFSPSKTKSEGAIANNKTSKFYRNSSRVFKSKSLFVDVNPPSRQKWDFLYEWLSRDDLGTEWNNLSNFAKRYPDPPTGKHWDMFQRLFFEDQKIRHHQHWEFLKDLLVTETLPKHHKSFDDDHEDDNEEVRLLWEAFINQNDVLKSASLKNPDIEKAKLDEIIDKLLTFMQNDMPSPH